MQSVHFTITDLQAIKALVISDCYCESTAPLCFIPAQGLFDLSVTLQKQFMADH